MTEFHSIIGPPGTGKTTRLAREVGESIDSGVDPKGIYMLSFTKAAAQETAAKVDAEGLGRVSTLHSSCFATLKMHPNSMMGRKHLHEFAASMGLQMYGIRGDSMMGIQEGDRCLSMMNFATARRMDPADVYRMIRHRPCSFRRFENFCLSYNRFKSEKALWDFDDLLIAALQMPAPEMDTMFIDEAQDLSPLQWAVVDHYATKARRVVVAGDPDQALYEWGGAEPLRMTKMGGTVEILKQSYRIPIRVHSIAVGIADLMKDRYPYVYNPKDEMGDWNYTSNTQLLDWDDEDTMVLVRVNAQKKEYEEILWRNCIPYSTLGGKQSPFDSTLGNAVRAVQSLKAGVSISKPLMDGLRRHATRNFGKIIDGNIRDDPKATELFKRMVDTMHLWQLVNAPREPLEGYYLENVDLDATPKVRLSTIHASKGREADRVILHLSTTKRIRQSYADFKDAELRCWYVGVTRAKKKLTLVQGRDSLLPWAQITGVVR